MKILYELAKLTEKQKRIIDQIDSSVKGWNHLLMDRSGGTGPSAIWQRVAKVVDGTEVDLFELKSGTNLLKPPLT